MNREAGVRLRTGHDAAPQPPAGRPADPAAIGLWSRASAGPRIEQPARPVRLERPLTANQEALWSGYRVAPRRDANNVAFAARVSGPVDRGALERALRQLVRRHPMLRSRFTSRSDGPVQVIGEDADVSVESREIVSADPAVLRREVTRAARRPFELERGIPFRVVLGSTSDGGEHALTVAAHRIAVDPRSLRITVDELRRLLHAEVRGAVAALPAPPAAYGDFVEWQAARLRCPDGERDAAYWRGRLGGALPMLRISDSLSGTGARSFRSGMRAFTVDAKRTAALRGRAAASGASLDAVLLAAYSVLLREVSGQSELVIGSRVACRERPELEGVVGCFENLVPLRLEAHPGDGFCRVLAGVREAAQSAAAHGAYPFALIVRTLAPDRPPFRTPIVQAVFSGTSNGRVDSHAGADPAGSGSAGMRFGDAVLEPIAMPCDEGRFELSLDLAESGGTLDGLFCCDTGLFAPGAAASLAGRFVAILEDIVAPRAGVCPRNR